MHGGVQEESMGSSFTFPGSVDRSPLVWWINGSAFMALRLIHRRVEGKCPRWSVAGSVHSSLWGFTRRLNAHDREKPTEWAARAAEWTLAPRKSFLITRQLILVAFKAGPQGPTRILGLAGYEHDFVHTGGDFFRKSISHRCVPQEPIIFSLNRWSIPNRWVPVPERRVLQTPIIASQKNSICWKEKKLLLGSMAAIVSYH